MKRPDAIKLVREIGKHFPGVVPTAPETLEAWAETLEDCEEAAVKRAALSLTRETETIYPGSNLGAMLRNRANPTITEATVSAHLNRALTLNSSPDGNPYEYLRRVDARLLEMAERADLFNRALPADSCRFAVRDISKQYLEEKGNAKKGYLPPDALPPSRQLPAPAEGLTPEQIETGKARLQEIRERLAGGMSLPQKGAA